MSQLPFDSSSPLLRPLLIVGGVVVLSLLVSTASFFPLPGVTRLKPVDFLSELTGNAQKEKVVTADIKKAEPPPPAFNDHDSLHLQTGFSPIENYYPDSNKRWEAFCDKLMALKKHKSKHRVRIAWLGDSQIEGDIFTQDVRRLLQQLYGGDGVGFVPIATHVPGFRKSVDFTFSKNWKTYSLADKKTRHSQQMWTLNGELFIAGNKPDEEEDNNEASTDSTSADTNIQVKKRQVNVAASSFATVRYTAVGDSFAGATLIYRGSDGEEDNVKYSIDGENGSATLLGTGKMATYAIKVPYRFKTLKFNMPAGTGTIYYGASFDNSTGVILDNYSLRGAAGLHLMAVKDNSITEYNKLLNYDLIVMQYGLNVATKGKHDYKFYQRDMQGVISRLHKLMPGAAILIVGVSDRSAKRNGNYETMPEVEEVLTLQKQLAQSTGCAFWSAFDAMGGEGSMVNWVDAKPSLANKDYTHLKPEGGKVLANYFNLALMYEVNKYTWLKKHRRA